MTLAHKIKSSRQGYSFEFSWQFPSIDPFQHLPRIKKEIAFIRIWYDGDGKAITVM